MTKDSLTASSISLEDEVFHREDEALKVWRLAVGYIIVGPWCPDVSGRSQRGK